ncbi:tetratricopeptide repeat protein [Halorussus salinisoli]|uniref:tetratricopeptide repeat protein n=1 Tax=Halorussus salinisoli TaxID=2558242 RepID=UPI0010C234A4|nr:tetratricopeptide repeat protein [Halorussus salinisoli]
MVVGEFITAASAAKTGYVQVRDWADSRRDIEAFDAFEQRFVETLERALEQLARQDIDCQIIVNRYEAHREDVLRQLKDVNFGDQQKTVDLMVDVMVEIVLEELEEYDIDEDDLRKAVETAYKEALEEFIRKATSEDQRLQLEMTRDIQENVEELTKALNGFKRQLNARPELIGRQEKYRLLYPPTDDNWIEELAYELEVHTERQELPFLEPEGFDIVTDSETERVLLAGRKGSGKSQTLVEGVAEVGTTVEFSRVVVVTDKIGGTEDLAKAFQTIDGDALLVFDDIQKSVTKGLDIEDALTELQQRVDPYDLYVRATVRSEDLGGILPEGWNLENLTGRTDRGAKHEQWTRFEAERLPPLEGERLERFVAEVLELHDIDVEDDLREEFIEAVTERDPTPFYVTSVCENAGSRLTRQDLKHLPDTAVEHWERKYGELDDATKDLLHAIIVLDTLEVEKRERVLKSLYESKVFGGDRFSAAIDAAAKRGWVTIKECRRRDTHVVIHDIRMEAVEFELEEVFFDLSEFLLNNRRVDRFPDDLGATMNAAFAEHVFENQLGTRPVEDADRHFERAIDLVQESPRVYTAYADFLDSQNASLSEIEDLYEEALELSPGDSMIRKKFALLLRWQGETDQAIEVYKEGLEQDSGDSLIRHGFAEFLAEQDEVDRAIEVYEEGLKHAPGDTNLRWCFAILLERLNKVDRAIEIYKEGLEQDPGDSLIRRSFAEFLAEQGEIDQAIKVYEPIIEQSSSNTRLREEFAEFLEECGLPDQEKKAAEHME